MKRFKVFRDLVLHSKRGLAALFVPLVNLGDILEGWK